MRLFCLIAALALPATGMAQDACTGPELGPQASLDDSFDSADALSAAKDVDRIAALEQQGWREYAWEVLAPGCIRLDFVLTGETAADAAQASMHLSPDGEVFMPIANGTLVQPGNYLSVLVAQKHEILEGDSHRFHPARFEITLAGQGAEADSSGPLLSMLPPTDALGCRLTGCGEAAEDAETVAVADDPDLSDPADQPGPGPTPAEAGDGSLAAELQAELARVGCYDGAIDGLWGPASRRAMTNFNHWAGNDAPVQGPTPKALVAVARATGPVCGVD